MARSPRCGGVTTGGMAPHRNGRSWLALILGAVALGTGLAWMLAAGWGVAPLDAFIAGMSRLTGLTIGTVIILTSSLFLVGAWFLGSRPGWGTLIAFVGVGAIVDAWNLLMFDWIGLAPDTWTIVARVLLWSVGFGLFALGVIATISSDLGANPYDQIIRAAHERFSTPLWASRLAFDGVVVLLAFVAGGAWGAGTIAIVILMPVALSALTPRIRTWIHGSEQAPIT